MAIKKKTASGMQLTQVGSSAIYAAPAPETLAFLLCGNTNLPKQLPLADTWTSKGTPPAVGYYLFLSSAPGSADPVKLEKQLRAVLPSAVPAATGCVWADNDDQTLVLVATLSLTLDSAQQPVVAADTLLPSGTPPLGFAAGTAVSAIAANADPGALVLSHPSLPNASTTLQPGVSIALTGTLTRCATFTGLMTTFEPPQGDSAPKSFVAVKVDPLDGPGTTTTLILESSLVLSKNASGYQISDVSWSN